MALAPTPDREELFSDALLLLAGTAISLWPAAVYYGVTLRVDTWTVLLGISCGFLWPMSLLAAVLFGGIDALNPVLIVRSILESCPPIRACLELGVLPSSPSAWFRRDCPCRGFCNAACLYLPAHGDTSARPALSAPQDRLGWGL
jgi:hypothetical protein